MSKTAKGMMNAYGKPEISLPNGEVLECEPLPLKRSMYWLKRGEHADAGDLEATYEICDEEKGFFREIGVVHGVEDMTPREAMVVFWTFFMANRFRKPEPTASPADGADQTSTMSS